MGTSQVACGIGFVIARLRFIASLVGVLIPLHVWVLIIDRKGYKDCLDLQTKSAGINSLRRTLSPIGAWQTLTVAL